MRQAAMQGLNFPAAESILCVGNILSSAGKTELERNFKAKVYNLYASTELGYVGLSCPHSGAWVHVDEDNYLVEIEGGGRGEVVVTDFSNFHMPVLRYRTGDIGELAAGRCGCGREGLRLRLHGRKKDLFRNEAGESFYAYDADEFLASEKELYALQIGGRQGALRLAVRPAGIPADRLEGIRLRFCALFKLFPAKVAVSCEEPLSSTPSGKFPAIVMERTA
jgi:phenylacetate-coenzyme A ligase PaaK-like adenylate-forming protein